MISTRIKICSICRPEDARLAAEAGADAIGVILHPGSKRYVSPEEARGIVGVLPPFVIPVGVFVDAGADQIREVAGQVGLRHVQLHGGETESVVAALEGFTVLKAVKVERGTFREQIGYWTEVAGRHSQLRGLVLETGGTHAAGGTGVENDWGLIEEVLGSAGSSIPMIAAGGLRVENVGEVVRRIRPYAVDISSGVEERVRVKSRQKVISFVEAVRSARVSGEGM